MKVTTLGIIQAMKNLGVWLATWTIAGIEAEPEVFFYALGIYVLVTVPTDMYILNKAHEQGHTDTEEEKE